MAAGQLREYANDQLDVRNRNGPRWNIMQEQRNSPTPDMEMRGETAVNNLLPSNGNIETCFLQ